MDKKKKDFLLNSLIYQSVICIAIFGVFYALKSANSTVYETIKTDFYSNLSDDLLKNKIDIQENESNNKENVTEVSTVESLTKISEKKQKSETLKTTKKSTEKTTLSANIEGKGGKDYKVKDESSIPENVSVNNYSLSKNMVRPVNGKITSGFGLRNHPITGKLRFHAGVDIAAKEGTPIYSSFDGTVIKSTYDSWNGNYLKIKHENNIMTVYCHCKELKVKKGDKVKAGQVIATIGSTGSSTGPHLHYELRINDISYDPEIALKTAINGV